MPPKIRELIEELERAGFRNRGGKGSHKNFLHVQSKERVTISGKSGDAAHAYQLDRVRNAIRRSRQ